MTRAWVAASAVAVLLAGCSRPSVPRSPKPAADRPELEARFDRLQPGFNEPQIEAYLGSRGAALAGYSTTVVRRKPADAEGAVAPGEADRYWPSADGAAAVRVVFSADGKARLVELLTITPMGPPPAPPPEPVVPPAP